MKKHLHPARLRTKSTSSMTSGGRLLQEMQVSRVKKPSRLTDLECDALLDVFTYFDTAYMGALPRDDVYRICGMLGLNIARSSIPAVVKRSEFLAFVDNNMIPITGVQTETEVLATTMANGIHSSSTEPAERITESAIHNFLEENNVAHSIIQVKTFVELLSPYDQVNTTDTNNEPSYILNEHFVEGMARVMTNDASRFDGRRPRSHGKH